MNLNEWIESSVWIISILLLLIYVPKNKLREAYISFSFMQFPSWLFGLAVVQLGWIEYPSRFFAHAVQTSFTYEFLAFPVISTLFNIHYPLQKGFWMKALYILAYSSALVIGEILILHYTNLIKYIHWNWYLSWISITLTIMLSYWFYKWFFRICKVH